jgi:hypothetical protein
VESLKRSSKPVRITVPQRLIAACGALGARVSSIAIAGDELRRRELGRRVMAVVFALLGLAVAQDGGAQAAAITNSATLAVVGDAAIVLDWRLTVLSLQQGATESNVILGPHPNSGFLLGYFVAAVAGYTASVIVLPKPWRYLIAIGVIGLESVAVARNLRWQSANAY